MCEVSPNNPKMGLKVSADSHDFLFESFRRDAQCAGNSNQQPLRFAALPNQVTGDDGQLSHNRSDLVFNVYQDVLSEQLRQRMLAIVLKQLQEGIGPADEFPQHRKIVDTESPGLRTFIWPILRPFLPQEFEGRVLVGLHPTARLIGHQCCKHCSSFLPSELSAMGALSLDDDVFSNRFSKDEMTNTHRHSRKQYIHYPHCQEL